MNPRLLTLPLFALAIGAALWWHQSQNLPAGVPACTWRIGDRATAAEAFEKVPADAPIRLAIAGQGSWHWYVMSWSQEDGAIGWFPTPGLSSSLHNPLGGTRMLLPGERGGRQLGWPMRSGIAGVTTWIAVASEQPLPELVNHFAAVRQASNSVFGDGSMTVVMPPDGKPLDGPRQPLTQALLQKALASPTEATNGPMTLLPGRGDIWFAKWSALCATGR